MNTPTPDTRTHPPRHIVRRSVILSVWVVVLGGIPLVAEAVTDSRTGPPSVTPFLATADARPPIPDLGAELEFPAAARTVEPALDVASQLETAAPTEPEAQLDAALDVAAPTAQPVPDVAIVPVLESAPDVEASIQEAILAVLTDSYDWDERGPRVEALQRIVSVEADGWYAHLTLRAHRAALQALELPTDNLPQAPVRVARSSSGRSGPSASQWAALRRCESSGNYSITNRSGKYRGAYQFDRPTWDSVASRHAPHLVGVDPAAAAPADQDAMAHALYRERGAQPWPQCGRHLR